MKLVLPFIAFLVLAAPAAPGGEKLPVAPRSPAAPEAGPTTAPAVVKLIDLKLFADTPKGHFGQPLARLEFPAGQKRQLSILYFDKLAAGKLVVVRIVGERTTLGLEKEVTRLAPAAIDATGRLPIEITYPQNWPPGLYRIEVIQGEAVTGSGGYLVVAEQPKKTPVTTTGIQILRERADGSLESAPAPKPADHHLYFVAPTHGARTGGARVNWVFTAVDTTAGKNIDLPSLEVKDWPLEDTPLTMDFEMPRDWPVGKYRVSVKVDGDLLKELDFEMK